MGEGVVGPGTSAMKKTFQALYTILEWREI